jgi:hypothetical protein
MRAGRRLTNVPTATTTARQIRAVALVVTLAALLAACGIGWEDQPISRVAVAQDDRTLTVGWHCHMDSSLTVEESPDEVRLLLSAYSYKGDCADAEQITLRDPLGDRALIDASTGRTVTPCAPADDDCL